MRKVIIGLTAGLALALVGVARADDTTTTQSKTTTKKNADGTSSHKSEKKSTHDPKGMGNATTDKSTVTSDTDKNAMGGTTTKIEKKSTHDAPGTANDRATDTKETVTRDAKGDVVKDEKAPAK
jgi:hypothetical protein